MPKKRFERIILGEVGQKYFNNYSKRKHKNIIAAHLHGIKTFRAIRNTKRYKDIEIYNYVYKKSKAKQFCAMTLSLKEDLTYVLFEGTDHLLSGWEEDFRMSYSFPVPAQKDAIRYLNRTIKLKDKNVIIGGHSKGGNLALVSAMYSHVFIKKKIRTIYNLDGPGVRDKQYDTSKYRSIKDKLISIIPNYSFVGTLLRCPEYRVVKAPRVTLFSHDLATWEVEDDHIKETKLSSFSKKFDEYMDNFVKVNGDKKLKQYVKSIFDILKKERIKSLEQINAAKFKSIIALIKRSNDLDDDTKKMATDFMKFLVKNYSDTAKEKVKGMIPKRIKN